MYSMIDFQDQIKLGIAVYTYYPSRWWRQIKKVLFTYKFKANLGYIMNLSQKNLKTQKNSYRLEGWLSKEHIVLLQRT